MKRKESMTRNLLIILSVFFFSFLFGVCGSKTVYAQEDYEVKLLINGSEYDENEPPRLAIGTNITLEVQVTGNTEDEELQYRWSMYSNIEEQWTNLTDSTSSINVIKPAGDISYSCSIITTGGNYVYNCGFYLPADNTLTTSRKINGEDFEWLYTSIKGDELTFSVDASSSYSNNITYQWYGPDGEPMENKTGSSCTVIKGSGYEHWFCVVSDGNETETCYFSTDSTHTLYVNAYIDDKMVQECNYGIGTDFTLEVKASSEYDLAKFSYQWYKENEDGSYSLISGATDSVYSGRKADREEVYYCDISDGNDEADVWFYLKPEITLSVKQFIGTEQTAIGTFTCGDAVDLKVTAESTFANDPENITYQWLDDDDEVLGTDSSFSAIKGSGNERYYCKVSDGNYTCDVTFILKSKKTLTIVQKIDGEKRRSKEVNVGETVILSVEADSLFKQDDGQSHFTYEWAGDTLDEDTDNTEPSITVTKSLENNNWGIYYDSWYYCTVSDGNETREVSFCLEPTDTLTVKQYINNQEIRTGSFLKNTSVVMKVDATSTFADKDALTYEWYYYDSQEEKVVISNEPSVEVTITERDIYYNCRISDGNCQKTVYFRLNQQSTLTATQYINDEETTSLEIMGEIGEEGITLRVEAETSLKNGTLSYQWYVYDDDYERQIIENEKTDRIIVSELGEYDCIISDGEDTVVCNFSLYSYFNPIDVICYVNDEVVENDDCLGYMSKALPAGQQVELKVEVDCAPGQEVTYKWLEFENDGFYNGTEIQNETSNSYSFTKGQGQEVYQCDIYVDGEYWSRSFVLEDGNISGESYINNRKTSEYDATPGEEIILRVQAESVSGKDLSYTWYDEDEEMISSGSSQYGFSIPSDDPYNEYNYYCKVSDGTSQTICYFSVYLDMEDNVKKFINGIETTEEVVDPGSDVTLSIQTTLDDVTYQWGKYNEWYDWIPISGETKDSLICKNVLSGDSYGCRVTYGEESEVYNFYLEIKSSLNVTQYIDDRETDEIAVPVNGTVQLSIEAFSLLPDNAISCIWYDSVNKKLGEGTSYQVTKKTDHTEQYHCKVSDGNVTDIYYFYLQPSAALIVKGYANGKFVNEITVNSKDEVELEVKVSADDTPINYQWYTSNNMTNYVKCENTTAKLTVNPMESTGYYCLVKAGSITKKISFTVWVSDEHIHTVVIDPAVAPTCTKDGLTEGRYCSECNYIIKKQTKIPASGHKWDSGVVTKQPTATETGIKTYTCTVCKETKTEVVSALGVVSNPVPQIGTVLTDSRTKAVYKVSANNQVEFVKSTAIGASMTIPATVTINNVKYNVTSIAAKAFKGNKKLKKIVIPSTVIKIGKQAFYGCKNLKSINIKSTKLTSKSFGSKALKGINAKATIKVPKKKLKAYKKILKKAGVSGKAKIK